MGPIELYLLCIALYAVLVPIAWMFAIKKGDSLTVANIIWTIFWSVVPLANTLACIGAVCWIYSNVADIEVVKGNHD